MVICQFAIFIGIVVLNGGFDMDSIQGGILAAAVFTASINILLGLPRGIIRCSAVALCTTGFAAMYYLGLSHPGDTGWPPPVLVNTFMGLLGWTLLAWGVGIATWATQWPGRSSWRSAGDGRVGRETETPGTLDRFEWVPASDRRHEPIFAPGVPHVLIFLVVLFGAAWLGNWWTSLH
jgi:hypothetical protein